MFDVVLEARGEFVNGGCGELIEEFSELANGCLLLAII